MNQKSNIENVYELTPLQSGILFSKLNNDKSTDYHVQYEVEYDFQLDSEIVEICINAIFEKHEILRTAFVIPKSTGVPKQVVLKNRRPNIQYLNADASMEQIKSNDLNKSFNLQDDCLFRMYVLNSECSSKILFSFHHIIMDGWSADILLNEFYEVYKKLAKGEDISNYSNNAFKFSDYIKWINQQEDLEGIDYWKKILSGYENSISIDKHHRDNSTLSNMERVKKALDETLSKQVIELSKRLNVTVNSVIESIWGLILAKYNYVDDVVFGKVVSGRQADIKGIEQAVGLFINTIPARVEFKDDETAEELIKKNHRQGIESIEYSYCSLSEINKEFSQKIVNTLFVFENYGGGNGDGQEDEMRVLSAREQVDCDITCVTYLDGDILNIELMYDPHDYIAEDMESILDRMENAILQICNHPMIKIGDIEWILANEISQTLNVANATDYELEYDNILQLFNKKVDENPNKVIAVCNEQEMTYLELDNSVKSLAEELRKKGVGKQDYVIIKIDRDINILIIVLSILTVGAVYVPVDKSYPQKRIDYIIKESGAKVIVSDEDETQHPDCEIINIKRDEIYTKNIESNTKVEQIGHDDVAYCLYTSGTTGNPKGVMVTHGNLLNYCYNSRYNVAGKAFTDENDVIIAITSFSFDMFVTESLLPLANGIKVVIANNDEFNNPTEIKKLIEKYKVNLIQTTPSKMKLIMTGMDRLPSSMKAVVLGGEALPDELCRQIKENSDVKIFNGYGPTETTVFSTICEYDIENLLGGNISNTKIYIMNNGKKCGVDMAGEICILGKGVSRGYLNNEDLTSQKYITIDNELMYKSGDLGKWTKEGRIKFLGRRDEQVKIRGLRIELKEIETCIKRIEGINETAVLVNNNRIYAFYSSNENININFIKSYISEFLPVYMLPSKYIKVEEMPVNINGKLDKKKLLSLDIDDDQKEYIPPTTKKEIEIINVFEEILKKDKIGLDDNFFDLGGDSMKAIIAITKLKGLGYSLSLRDLMKAAKFENIIKRSIEI